MWLISLPIHANYDSKEPAKLGHYFILFKLPCPLI